MKAPLSWLNEYVDISNVSVEELKNKLFSCGFEVEEVIYVNKDVSKIVFCRIEEIAQHPNADKLSVCQVNAGKYGVLQIVTNAKNIKVGDIVPVSVDGAILADGTKIKAGNLRGVPSAGMFCGGEEIGINDAYYDGASFDGVLVFKEEYPLGEEVADVLQIKDVVFDISITANRPDCQSILGVAREVAAVLDKPLKMPAMDFVCSKVNNSDMVSVTVKNPELCPRYMANFIDNVRIAPSPQWMQKRLSLCGIKPINNMVDITNYVLLEIGQPMHAFDYRLLSSNSIVVRTAEKGEKITTLDEKTFDLDENVLVICDANKPVCLAGIMGGLNSGVTEDTKQIVFESAKFKRDCVRKTSRRLGQRSDSSARFEKGVDVYSVETGLNRALNLVYQLDAGDIGQGIIDVLAESKQNKVINTTTNKINSLLGIVVPNEKIVSILNNLEFNCKLEGENLTVTVPLYREDVEDYPDLAEEIIRMYGYDNIDCTLFEDASITMGGYNEYQAKTEAVKTFLINKGFNEAINYSFVSDKDAEVFELEDNSYIKIINALGEDMSVMRTTLMPSMVYTVLRNLNRKNLDGRLFELAKTYIPHSLPLTELPEEKNSLCLAIFGENEDFYTLKGVVESMLNLMQCSNAVEYNKSQRKYLHPTRGAELIIDGENFGYLGELHPEIAEKLGIDKRVYVAEIKYEDLKDRLTRKIYFKSVPKYPSVERDLALVMDDAVTNAEVVNCIKYRANKSLVSVKLFDVYKGVGVPEGKKSMAYRLTFVALDRTLSVEEVDGYVGRILNNLKQINVELR